MKTLQLILACLTLAFASCWQISDGERAGIVTKFSHKGVIWATWEGELHYAGANGTIAADSWKFSLDNGQHRGEAIPELVTVLTEAQRNGKRVKVTYKQELIVAPWRSDTDYLVQSVEILE